QYKSEPIRPHSQIMPPPLFLLPPMPPPPRPTSEPEPPRLVSLDKECVENGTCINEDELNMDVFCLHDMDPNRNLFCSPHHEMGGIWIKRQCPAGLLFSGQQCERTARISSNKTKPSADRVRPPPVRPAPIQPTVSHFIYPNSNPDQPALSVPSGPEL